LTAYIEVSRDEMRPSTLESYMNTIKRVPDDLSGKDLIDLRAHDLDLFFANLKSRGYASSTVKQTHAVIRAALAQAVRWEWISTNPAISVRTLRDERQEERIATPAEVYQLAVTAGANGDTTLAMAILLAAVLGCRRGELCGLRWEDIDAEVRSIRIERQWVPGRGGQYLDKPKSKGGIRVVYLDPEVLELLERYRKIQRTEIEHEPDGWMLSYDAGRTPLRAKALTEAIARLVDETGLTGISTHSFRRMSASELIAAGVDVSAAASRMGHTREVMFERYVRPANDRSVAAASLLHERLKAQGLSIGELLAADPS
jgi:integrase